MIYYIQEFILTEINGFLPPIIHFLIFNIIINQRQNMWNHLETKQKQRVRDFISGLVAGVISVTICNPLDIVRTRLNLMSSSTHEKVYRDFRHALKTIWKKEGLKGLFSGYKINVKAIPIFHSIFFPVYEETKDYCRKRNFTKWQQYLTSSVIAGSFCNIATNPIWVIRTRVMAQALHPEHLHYETDHILKIMNEMVIEEGPSSLLKGVSASILGVSNAVIYFFIYENFKEKIVEKKNRMFNTYYVFAASILAKLIASTATYPFIVARTIMQDHRTQGDSQLIKMSDVFKDVYKKRGIKGFYAGLRPDLLRILPSNSIVFMVYEFMKRKIKIGPSTH